MGWLFQPLQPFWQLSLLTQVDTCTGKRATVQLTLVPNPNSEDWEILEKRVGQTVALLQETDSFLKKKPAVSQYFRKKFNARGHVD